MAKITFGFKNVNGAAFDLRIMDAPEGSWPNESVVGELRDFVIRKINKAGREAVRITRLPGWSPFLTGALINSIRWQPAKESEKSTGRVLAGALTVGVPYGRRQEFEHKTRSRYLQRALEAVYPEFLASLNNKGAIGDILFSRRKQIGSSGVRGGSF